MTVSEPTAGDSFGHDLLRNVLDAISSVTELDALADMVAKLVTDAVGADVCFVHLVEEPSTHLGLIGATPPYNQHRGKIRLAVGDGIAGWVAQAKTPVMVPDKWKDTRYRYMPELGGKNFAYLISVPMMRPQNKVVGVLNVHWKVPPTDPEEVMRELQYVANLFAANVELAALVEALERREKQLEEFATNVINAQELERKRIAGDIHDGLGQLLHSTLYHLDAATYPEDLVSAREEIGVAKELLERAISEVKSTISRLRPRILDDLGLLPGLASLAASVGRPEVATELPEALEHQLPSATETAVYRIAQEALANIQKHSGATWASIKLWEDPQPDAVLHLVITDDGDGIEPERGEGLGMVGMQERAELIGAKLDIYSRRGHGTRVHLRLPL
ncbi:MAG: GAF domain-containing sensor histidine kinase [Actinomycetota bacterium]|nr:GAF domain-containing sensor histidine kinase [Actinomycetota bacterium]